MPSDTRACSCCAFTQADTLSFQLEESSETGRASSICRRPSSTSRRPARLRRRTPRRRRRQRRCQDDRRRPARHLHPLDLPGRTPPSVKSFIASSMPLSSTVRPICRRRALREGLQFFPRQLPRTYRRHRGGGGLSHPDAHPGEGVVAEVFDDGLYAQVPPGGAAPADAHRSLGRSIIVVSHQGSPRVQPEAPAQRLTASNRSVHEIQGPRQPDSLPVQAKRPGRCQYLLEGALLRPASSSRTMKPAL